MKKINKRSSLILIWVLIMSIFMIACSSGKDTKESQKAGQPSQQKEETAKQESVKQETVKDTKPAEKTEAPIKESKDEGKKVSGKINVYTRDAASGTREGFEKVVGFEGELTDRANEVASNGEMSKQVGQDIQAIGYVSLTTDFAGNNLRPLKYEGVEPSLDTVNNGEYLLNRPFSYTTRAKGDYESPEKEQLIAAFIDYLTKSTEGMEVVLANGGIVDLSKGVSWDELKANHPIVEQDNSAIEIVTGGSTSVEKTLTAALESFQGLAGNFQFKINQTGSSDGWKRALGDEKDGPNKADLGFASRAFKNTEEDTSQALASGVYCKDAIVAVVNAANENFEGMTKAQLVAIFTGAVEDWEKIPQ